MAKSKSAKIKEARRAREASLGGTLQNAFENQKQRASEIYDRRRSERGESSSDYGGKESLESTQPKAGGTQAGGTAPGGAPKIETLPGTGNKPEIATLPGPAATDQRAAEPKNPLQHLWDSAGIGTAAEEAQRQSPMTTSANRQSDKKAEEKRMNALGKEAEAAYKPNEEQERFAEDARRYSAERNAAREREAAAEKKNEVPATPSRSDKPAPGVVKPSQQIEQGTDAGTGNGNVYTNRRDELQRELDQITQYEGYITDPDEANRTAARKREIMEELGQVGLDSRVGNVLAGATKQYASGLVNSAGTTIDALAAAGELYGNASPYAGYATDELSAETIGTGTEEERQAWAAEMQRVQDAAAEVEAVADSLGESAARDLANAKDGLSGLGQAGVDIATNVIQMGYDAALGKIPGVGSLAAMFVRSAGSSAQEARQEGADVGEQLAYGITKGGIEVATEKLFDGVAGIFGKGAADDVVEGAIRRLARTDTGRTVLRALAGAGGEGTEEAISDLLSPFAEMIYKDESLGELFQGLSGSEILYDFLIGAAIGGLGSGGSIATGQNAAKNAEARQADAAEARVNSMMDGAMEALENPNAGQNQNAPLDPSQILAEQVTGPQAQPVEGLTAEDQRAEQRQQRQKADEVVDTLLGPMADAQAKEEAAERVAEILATPTQEATETPQEAPETPGDIPAPPTAAETNTGESPALNSGLANEGEGIGQRQTTRSAAPSQQNIDNAAGNGYTETNGTTMPEVTENGTGRSAEENRNGVPGVYEGRDSDNPGQGGSAGAPGNAGIRLLNPEAQNTLKQSGVYAEMQESSADNAAFSAALDEARIADQANGWAVTPKTKEELDASGARTFMNAEGNAGFAVASDGDIEAVFANKSKGAPKGVSRSTIPQAIANGGVKLDCYGAGLVRLYSKHGFVPVARVTFNPEYANPGWDSSKGSPDIFFMMYTGTDADAAVQNYGTYPVITQADLDALPVMEYDEAYAYRDSLLDQQRNGQTAPTGETGLTPTESSEVQQNGEGNGTPPVPPEGGGGGLTQPGTPAQKRSQTESNTLHNVAEALGGEQEELYYIPITERQTLTEAVNRVRADMNGEMQKLMDKDLWTAADIDTGLTLYGILKADAVRTGDNTAANAWAKIVQTRGTRSAQALQAFSKWTRSGIGQANEAIDQLNEHWEEEDRRNPPQNEEQRQQREEQRNRTRNDILDFGQQLDEIEDGDFTSIRDLIQRQSEYRGTGTFVQRNYRRILDEIEDYDYLREYATRQLFSIAEDQTVDASLGQRIKTWQVNAQLSRLGTFFRNIGGNVVFGLQDTLTQDGLGVAIDRLVSHATGHRTVGADLSWFSQEARRGSRAAMLRSILEVAGDVNMGGNTNRYGTNANRTNKMNGNGFERFMSRWEQLLGYSLTTSDQTSRGQIEEAIRQSLRNTDLTEEQIQAIAEQTADYRLFQNHDRAYQISKGLHDVLNVIGFGGEINGNARSGGFGLGDLVNPYPGVPANLAVKALEYSPANIIKGSVELHRVITEARHGNYDAAAQNRAVMDVARGLAGAPIIYLLTAMFKSGLAKNADDEDDLDAAAQNKAEGKTGVQINLDAWDRANKGESTEWKDGDDLLSIGWLEPMNAFMAIASMAAEEDDASLGTMAGHYLNGALQSVLDMPVMGNISNIVDNFKYSTAENIGGKAADAAIGFLGDAASGMIPAPVSQAARTRDQYYRDVTGDNKAEQVINSLFNSIPGLRETLPIKTDNFGNPKEYSGDAAQRFLNNFVLPGSVNELNQTETSAAVEDLYVRTGDAAVYPDRNAPTSFNVDGEKTRMTSDERRAYHQTYGDFCDENIGRLLTSGQYDDLSDSEKVDMIGKIKEFANYYAKRGVMESRGDTYTDKSKEKTAKILDTGIDLVSYLTGKAAVNEDGNGDLKVGELYDWLYQSDYSDEQKAAIWDANYSGDKSFSEYATSEPATVLTNAGMSYDKARKTVQAMNTNGGEISQKEIKAYYASHKGDEVYLRALWDAMGWKTSWDKAMK